MIWMKTNSLSVVLTVLGLVYLSNVAAETAQSVAAEQSALPLSAFFGLDNKLPFGANVLCLGVLVRTSGGF